jgi:hypothetical protein
VSKTTVQKCSGFDFAWLTVAQVNLQMLHHGDDSIDPTSRPFEFSYALNSKSTTSVSQWSHSATLRGTLFSRTAVYNWISNPSAGTTY